MFAFLITYILLTDETTQGGYECPSGYHCPPGTPVPLRCSPGGYSDEPRLAECKNCSAGYYCPGNSTDTTTYRCEPGYYCPEGWYHAVIMSVTKLFNLFNNLNIKRLET